MNKVFFYIFLVFLALGITLGAVYYLNLGNIKQIPASSDSRVPKNSETTSISDSSKVNTISEYIITPENNNQLDAVPSNYTDQELIDLEKELNSLDLSSENDIE